MSVNNIVPSVVILLCYWEYTLIQGWICFIYFLQLSISMKAVLVDFTRNIYPQYKCNVVSVSFVYYHNIRVSQSFLVNLAQLGR